TALGAAYLAGLGAGIWSTVDEVAHRWTADARFHPAAERDGVDAAYAQWRRGVTRAQGWATD
ncbi:MAG: glycerol kinase, partial [Actinomycetes bacterium]